MSKRGPPPARPTATKPGASSQARPEATSGRPATSGPPKLKDYLPFMKAGGNASAAIDSVADDLEGFDDLDDVELPDVSATPKLKDYLPFMAKGGKSGSAGNAIAAVAAAGDIDPSDDLSDIPPQLLKYLPQNMTSSPGGMASLRHQRPLAPRSGQMPQRPAMPRQRLPMPGAAPAGMPHQAPGMLPRQPFLANNSPFPANHPSQGPLRHMAPSQQDQPRFGHQSQNFHRSQPQPPQASQASQASQNFQPQMSPRNFRPSLPPHSSQLPNQMQAVSQPQLQMQPGPQSSTMSHPGSNVPGLYTSPGQPNVQPTHYMTAVPQSVSQPMHSHSMTSSSQMPTGYQVPPQSQIPASTHLPPGMAPPHSQGQFTSTAVPMSSNSNYLQGPSARAVITQSQPHHPSVASSAPASSIQFTHSPVMPGMQSTSTPQGPPMAFTTGAPVHSHTSVHVGPPYISNNSHIHSNTSGIQTTAGEPSGSIVTGGPPNQSYLSASGPQTVPISGNMAISNPPSMVPNSAQSHSHTLHQAPGANFVPSHRHAIQPQQPQNVQPPQNTVQQQRQTLPPQRQHAVQPPQSIVQSSPQHAVQPQQSVQPQLQYTTHPSPQHAAQQEQHTSQPQHRQTVQPPQQHTFQGQQPWNPVQNAPSSVSTGPRMTNPICRTNVPISTPPSQSVAAPVDLLNDLNPGNTGGGFLQPMTSESANTTVHHQKNVQEAQLPKHPTFQPPVQHGRVPQSVQSQGQDHSSQMLPQQSQQPNPPFQQNMQASQQFNRQPQPLSQQHMNQQLRPQSQPNQQVQQGNKQVPQFNQQPQLFNQQPQQTNQQPLQTNQQPQQMNQHSQQMKQQLPQLNQQPPQLNQQHQQLNQQQQQLNQQPQQLNQQSTEMNPLTPNPAVGSQQGQMVNTAVGPIQSTTTPERSKRTLPQNNTGGNTQNPPSIPVLAVSPQPKSHVSDLEGVSISSTAPRLDSSFESKIDWSKATVAPKPTNKTEVPQWAPSKQPPTPTDDPKKASLSRQASKESRVPYSDEASLDQFVSAVERYVKQLDTLTKPSLKGPTPLDKEWTDMAEEQERESKRNSTAAGLSEPTRNRHPDVIPYDKYRVSLSGQKNDYINASLIDNLPGCPRFIATQGPLNQTEADFWNMIIQQRVELMVMLPRWTEHEHTESARYWPRDRNDRLSFGNLLITLQLSNNHKFWIERRMNMTNLVTKETHTCTQLQFTCWPSDQLPEPMPLLMLVNEVTSLYKKQRSSNTPIIVHCGNGIAQTGVFCTLYNGVLAVNSGQGIVSVGHTVGLLRQRRRGMVGSKEEYLFCHTALLYYAQDILVKRGILTSQASFSKPLAHPGNQTHGRTPSNDFIMSDTSLALMGELSLTATGAVSLVSSGAAATDSTSTRPPPQGSVAVQVKKVEDNSASRSSADPVKENLNPPADVVNKAAGDEPKAAPMTDTAQSATLLDISNPQTFDIGQGRQRITKADFTHPSGALNKNVAKPDDPFSSLDPMWSLGSN